MVNRFRWNYVQVSQYYRKGLLSQSINIGLMAYVSSLTRNINWSVNAEAKRDWD